MTSLTIQKSLENDTYTITVSGRLDTSNSVQFDNESRPCTKDAKKMILDFEHLEYISSSGPQTSQDNVRKGRRACCQKAHPHGNRSA